MSVKGGGGAKEPGGGGRLSALSPGEGLLSDSCGAPYTGNGKCEDSGEGLLPLACRNAAPADAGRAGRVHVTPRVESGGDWRWASCRGWVHGWV